MFRYFLIKYLRTPMWLFWSLVFPIALMFFMNMAFGGIYDIENSINPMDAYVVYTGDGFFAEGFRDVLNGMSDSESEHHYLNLTEEADRGTAEEKIRNKEAEILFVVGDDDITVCLSEDHSQTAALVAGTVSNVYKHKYGLITDAIETDPALLDSVLAEMDKEVSVISDSDSGFVKDPNPYMWYFYSTFVMGLFFNAVSGVGLVGDLQANVSSEAMRLSVSPSKKSKMIICGFISRLIPSIVIAVIQLLIMRTAFDISLGTNIPLLAVFTVSCVIFSLCFGVLCGLIFKGPVNVRGNRTTALIMVSVFLSGEMVAQLPGVFEKYCPIINDINPATLMNMAFYRMALAGDVEGFFMNIGKIIVASVIFLVIGIIVLRREKYASV